MAQLGTPRPSPCSEAIVLHVDYLESAPWNAAQALAVPRFLGVGTVLLAEAVRISGEMGLGGRVGLHALPQAEDFYRSQCRMTEFGKDVDCFDLTYFEFTSQQATDWLAATGESLMDRDSRARFRQAAEAEGGVPVSAGARVGHVRTAVEAGRGVYVDLTSLPEQERAAVVAGIKELVARAVGTSFDTRHDAAIADGGRTSD
jgi:hypothetical protein